ncbi:TonB-dependent receptor [Prolixibacteraceae bacterium JC049]|nr:TonB-dependent receptor [Prolixibacteraceae bacterium JC049]
MRTQFILLILSLFAINTFAQRTTVIGKVIDAKTGEPLPSATVIDEKKNGTTTDLDGHFKIQIDHTQPNLKLTFSFIGYITVVNEFTANSSRVNIGTIKLAEDIKSLGEVVVAGKAPIARQKGDTLSFNASSVKVHNEAKGTNLIKKLPGFSVKNHKIETQGEQVKKIYVNGKPFFEDDPQSALNALPADVIKNIELFDDYGEVASFTGYASGNSVKAINIVTKASFKNKTLGQYSAGIGSDNRYNMEGNTMITKGNHDLSFIFERNNINKSNTDLSDFKSFEAQIAAKAAKELSSQPQSFGEQTIRSFGVNYNFHPNAQHELAANYTMGTIKNELNQFTIQNHQDVLQYNYFDTLNTESKLHKLSLKYTYEPSRFNKYIISEKLFVMDGSAENKYNRSALVYSDPLSTSGTQQSVENSAIKSKSNMIWLHNFGDSGRSLTAIGAVNINNDKSDQVLVSHTDKYILLNDMFSDTVSYSTDQQEHSNLNDNMALLRVSYKEPLSMLTNLNFVASSSYSWGNAQKDVFLFDPVSSSYQNINNDLSSHLKTNYWVNKAELGYSSFSLKLIFNAGVAFENAQLQDQLYTPEATERTYENNALLPFIFGRYYINADQNLTFFARTKTSLPSTTQLQPTVNVTNPLQVTTGNPDLKAGTQYIAMLRYLYTMSETSKYLSIYGFYRYGHQFIGQESFYLKEPETLFGSNLSVGTNVTRPVNLNGFHSIISGLDYSFPINPIRCNINSGLRYTYNEIPTRLEEVDLKARNHQASANIAIASNISQKVDFFISGSSSYNHASNTENDSTTEYLTNEISADLNFDIWRGIKLQASYQYNHFNYFDKAENQEFSLLNLSVGKSFWKEKASLNLKMYDVLNQNKGVTFNFQETYTENIVSNALQQYVMLSFNYKF